MSSAGLLDSFLNTFWTFLGAAVGIAIGVTKEGAQVVSSLTSAAGWQKLYTGSPAKPKKADHEADAFIAAKPTPALGIAPSWLDQHRPSAAQKLCQLTVLGVMGLYQGESVAV